MNIKTYMAIAVAALTAACSQEAEVVEAPADGGTVAAEVQLSEEGQPTVETVNPEQAAESK